MRGILALIEPWDRLANAYVQVRVGAARNSRTLGCGGNRWETAFVRLPRLSIEHVDEDITGQLMIARGDMTLTAKRITQAANIDALEWVGARVTIYSGDGPLLSDMRLEFKGRIKSGVKNRDTGQIPITMEVDRKLVDVPLLNAEYGGGGGADGDPEVRGQLKPAAFGRPVNVPVFFFDQVNNVGQVDAYGNMLDVAYLFEDGGSFGPKLGDYPSYAALVAANIPEGAWATCTAEGMVRLGAPPQGVITCDPICGADRPGSLALRWLTVHAGVSVANIDTASFDALTAQVEALLGRAAPVNYWTQSQVNTLDRLQKLAASCNAVPLIGFDGRVVVSRVFGGNLHLVIDRQGGRPLVTAWRSLDATTPWWRLKMRAAVTYRTHSEQEIDYEDDIDDRGDYVPGETYRTGQVARNPADGIRYLYTSATPSSGNAPPNAAFWEVYEDAPDASVVKYLDGVPVQARQPQEAGANKTETRVASSIASQGLLATQNYAKLGDTVRRADGLTTVTEATVITALGTASGIAGQGALATLNAAAWSTQVVGSGKPSSYATANVTFGVTAAPGAVWKQEGNSFLVENSGGENGLWIGSDQGISGPFVVRFRHNAVAGTFVSVTPIKGGWAGHASYGLYLVAGNAQAFNPAGEPTGISWAYADAALHELAWDGRVLRYSLNGVSKRTVTANLGTGPLYFMAIWNYAGAGNRLYDVEFFPANDRRSYRDDAATVMGQIEIRTAEGTASAIAGQGALATLAQVNLGASGRVYREDGVTRLTDILAITSMGTASAVAGQGSLATKNQVDLATSDVIGKSLANLDGPANTKLSGIEATATRNVPDRALNRNSSFVDGLTGWANPYSGDISAIASASSVRGGYVAKLNNGFSGAKGEHIPCTPGEVLYLAYRFRTQSNRTGGAAPTWYFGLSYAATMGGVETTTADPYFGVNVSAAAGWQSGVYVSPPVPAGCYAVCVRGVIDAGSTGTGCVGEIDYAEIHRDQPGATVGSIFGTNAFRANGTTLVTDTDAITALGTASAIAGQGALATKSVANLDTDIAEGTTYKRVAAADVGAAGVLKLSQSGSGRKLGGSANLPNVVFANQGSKFTGTISYSSSAGTPSTATISITAGNLISGAMSTAYNALNVGVTGTGGTTVVFYLYGDDPTNAGGSITLVATTTPLTVYQSDGRIWFGSVPVFFPSTGTGGGSGGGGGGGGGYTVPMP